jgi:hypothetical protein
MKSSVSSVFLTATLMLFPAALIAQGGGYMPGMAAHTDAPKLPGIELEGPLDSASAPVVLQLNAEQARRYAQAYDSFMVATQPQRDSAAATTAKMNERLEMGDRAAALFYVDRLQEIGKHLKDRQDKFEENLKKFLTGDQIAYAAGVTEALIEESSGGRCVAGGRHGGVRRPFRQRGGAGHQDTGGASARRQRTLLGAQALRVGRALYITGQLGSDSTNARRRGSAQPGSQVRQRDCDPESRRRRRATWWHSRFWS